MMLLAFLIVLTARQTALSQVIILCGLAVLFRANNLADLTGFYDQTTTHFTGSRITSVGILLLCLGMLVDVSGRVQREGHVR
jgi:NADH:ubiquinone oxidoreductase subunit 2 (subunit N)